MDYEHQPTRGPSVWIGAGLLLAVAGAALLWVSQADASDLLLAVAGSIMTAGGLACTAGGMWVALRRRR